MCDAANHTPTAYPLHTQSHHPTRASIGGSWPCAFWLDRSDPTQRSHRRSPTSVFFYSTRRRSILQHSHPTTPNAHPNPKQGNRTGSMAGPDYPPETASQTAAGGGAGGVPKRARGGDGGGGNNAVAAAPAAAGGGGGGGGGGAAFRKQVVCVSGFPEEAKVGGLTQWWW